MTKFVGRRGTVGVAKETVRGTAITTPTFWLGRNTISFDDKTETVVENEALGRIDDSDDTFLVSRFAEGEIEMDVRDREIGIVLTSLFGASPVTAGADPYTHTYSLDQTNTHQSLSITYQDPDTTKTFPLGVVGSFQLTAELDSLVTATFGFMSKTAIDGTSETTDFTDLGRKFIGKRVVIGYADTVGELLSNSTQVNAKTVELNINANTVKDDILGTVAPDDILNQQFSVEGSFTLLKEDETIRSLMNANSQKAMLIAIVNESGVSQMSFTLPKVFFSEWEQDRGLDSIVSQSVNFKANYDFANDADIISCTLTNNYDGTDY